MLQLTSQRRYDQSLDEYFAKIERKTAVLLAASTFCGAVLGGLGEGEVERMRRFGRYIGMSFQIADDVLDYLATEKEVGKPVGNDLKQGTVTLPLMLARSDPTVNGRIEAILNKPVLRDADYAEVVRIVRDSRGIDESYEYARDFSEKARAELEDFPPSPHRDGLESLTYYVVRRRS
jgi:geranylgeranyl pyrophosphate synthase